MKTYLIASYRWIYTFPLHLIMNGTTHPLVTRVLLKVWIKSKKSAQKSKMMLLVSPKKTSLTKYIKKVENMLNTISSLDEFMKNFNNTFKNHKDPTIPEENQSDEKKSEEKKKEELE